MTYLMSLSLSSLPPSSFQILIITHMDMMVWYSQRELTSPPSPLNIPPQLRSLKTIFTAAIQKAFPQIITEEFGVGIITRCGNPSFGDFQCNNSLSIAKYFKTLSDYSGSFLFNSHITSNNFKQFLFLFILDLNWMPRETCLTLHRLCPFICVICIIFQLGYDYNFNGISKIERMKTTENLSLSFWD